MAGWLRRFGEVRALDFRGHGLSGGGSAVGGDPELLDVDTAALTPFFELDSPERLSGRIHV